jgi:hypothetical protein
VAKFIGRLVGVRVGGFVVRFVELLLGGFVGGLAGGWWICRSAGGR